MMEMRKTHTNDERRLYGDLAWTWPIFSPVEDYIEENEETAKIIHEHSRIKVRTLLHLGCGGGHDDYTLKKHFEVTGVDISTSMINLAKKLNPEATYLVGDMRTIRLGKLFDTVAIFDSIDYMLAEQEVRSAFTTAFVHLRPGGVFLTYQENSLESFKQNHTEHSTHSRGDTTITFIDNYYDPDPTDTTLEATFIYLIRKKGELQIETDRHTWGIFPKETWLTLLTGIGFDVEVLDLAVLKGMPLFVCTKSP